MSAGSSRPVPGADRLVLGVNPLRLLFSASPWQAAGFLLTYLLVSGVLFSITLVAGVVALVLAVTIVAVPLLIVAALVVRGCAIFERIRLRQVLGEPVPDSYPPPDEPGLWRRAKAMWRASGTWRELAYFVGLWPLLLALDAIVFAAWAYLLAGMTFPAWYSSVRGLCIGSCGTPTAAGLMIGHFPAGPHGIGADGIYVDSLHGALVVAAVFLVLFLLFNYVLVATARMHGRVARALLRPPADPLEEVRSVLTGPGPLGSLTSAEG
jgi:Putative sensor